jgi:hypothetical protein
MTAQDADTCLLGSVTHLIPCGRTTDGVADVKHANLFVTRDGRTDECGMSMS